MRPGEVRPGSGTIALASGRRRVEIVVTNASDRAIGVGSHVAFATVNAALHFDRDVARRMRLDVPAGEIVWFEPGARRAVTLVGFAGQEAGTT